MQRKKRPEWLLIAIFLIFSWWLVSKSFSYDHTKHQFVIARHQVGDFGLHLSLIRSFSWGNNFPPELPFFPGEPLPYHYEVDFVVGMLERWGVRVDHAFNTLSSVSLTILLYAIYRLANVLFKPSFWRGILSVGLFLFSSNLSFVNFFKDKTLSVSLVKEIWRFPDYTYKGPFDGSTISIFSTLNPLLNQRHLIVGLTVSLLLLSFLMGRLLKKKTVSVAIVVIIGAFIGVSTRIHSLVAVSTAWIVVLLLIFFKRLKLILPFLLSAFFLAFPHARLLLDREGRELAAFFHPGYLATSSTAISWLSFWWQNLGLMIIFLPIGVFLANPSSRRIFFIFASLFVIANLFQLSYRMEHNHSVIALSMIVANIFVAEALVQLWRHGIVGKVATIFSLFGLTASGFLNLMVVKNDFQYRVDDVPESKLMTWIKTNTSPEAIFLAPQNLYDPVTLSGRKNYLGATYYLEVMGYDFRGRQLQSQQFFEASSMEILQQIREAGIQFVIIPTQAVDNFPYKVSKEFWLTYSRGVYSDETVSVFAL